MEEEEIFVLPIGGSTWGPILDAGTVWGVENGVATVVSHQTPDDTYAYRVPVGFVVDCTDCCHRPCLCGGGS
jgi:hypothetical protein